MFKNPIISGFYPDPSIIRVKDDFYLVNSSFEYFPAIPVWHSKDLINWKQIGNAVTDKSQGLDLSDVEWSQGVQAVTIRHHKNKYYITSTRVKNKWPRDDYHFIMETNNPHGPWGKVHYIKDAYGIDSSLFFDEDKAYFLANRQKLNSLDGSDTEIWIQEINLDTYELIGEKRSLWDGTGGHFPEGPHIYKRNGYYYLLIAEGGTLHNHTVTIARSKNLFGPYKSSVRNPILTHKNLDRAYPIQNVGHADLVELHDGSWWGVCLGSRPRGGFYDGKNIKYSFGGYYRNLGRETFLFPVKWPNDNISPLFSPDTGKIEGEYHLPNLKQYKQADVKIDLSYESFYIKWCVIKKENKDHIKLREEKLYLTLLDDIEKTFIGFRQDSWKFRFKINIDLSQLTPKDYIGITSYMTKNSNLSVIFTNSTIKFISKYIGEEKTLKQVDLSHDKVTVEILAVDQNYTFRVLYEHTLLAEYTFDGRVISADLNDTHTGSFIGIIGESNKNTTCILSDLVYVKME